MWGRKQQSRSKRHREPLNKINQRRSTPRYTTIKMAKSSDKEGILKSSNLRAGKKNPSYILGKHLRLSVDFLAEIPQARREWHDRFKVMKGEK